MTPESWSVSKNATKWRKSKEENLINCSKLNFEFCNQNVITPDVGTKSPTVIIKDVPAAPTIVTSSTFFNLS